MFAVVSLVVTIAAFINLRNSRVCNFLTLPFTACGILFHTLTPWGWCPEFALLGSLLGFGLLFIPFLAGGVRVGDLKLMAGVGAWLGPRLTIWIFLVIGGISVAYHVGNAIRRRSLRELLHRLQVLHCRLTSLLHYLAAEDGLEDASGRTCLRRRVLSLTALICVSTLLLIGLILSLRT
jgi:prepilin peptidase CpaA